MLNNILYLKRQEDCRRKEKRKRKEKGGIRIANSTTIKITRQRRQKMQQ